MKAGTSVLLQSSRQDTANSAVAFYLSAPLIDHNVFI